MRGMISHAGDDPRWRGVARKGGGGTSSNSSSNTQDQRAAIGGNGLLAAGGSTINFTIENPDVVAAALETGAGFYEKALEFAHNQSVMTAAAFGKATDAIQASKQSAETNFGFAAIKSAGPIILIVGLGLALAKARA